jgi:heptaprenylglyceryl phosphate synthase
VENRENPFTANGELSQKADYIISHSTITRTEVLIADPDAEKKAAAAAAAEDQTDAVIVAHTTQVTESAAPVVSNNSRYEEPVVTTTSVEVEVAKGSAAPAQPQHAEEVKLKKKKCCTIV